MLDMIPTLYWFVSESVGRDSHPLPGAGQKTSVARYARSSQISASTMAS